MVPTMETRRFAIRARPCLRARLSAALLAVALAACASAGRAGDPAEDGGATLEDAGVVEEVDAGAPPEDAGPPALDGGPPPQDGGARDAGPPDAGRDDRTWPAPVFTVRAPSDLQEPTLGVNAYFSPTEDTRGVVTRQLDTARNKLRVAMFSIGDASISRKLMAMRQAGIDIHILWDKTQSESGASDDNYRVLEDAGIRLTKIGFDGGAAFASMHDKFAVLDDARVMTGSHNWSLTGFTQNYEHLLTLEGAPYAALYNTAWQAIAAGRSASTPYVPDAGFNVQFGAADRPSELVLRRIQQARRSIYVAMFDLSYVPLVEALIAARARGVRVVLVMDRNMAVDTSLDEVLECGGRYVDGGAVCTDGGLGSPVVRANAGGGSFVKMHQKYSVYDEEWVIAGSYNWTNLATFYNHENVVELRSPRMAQRFLGNFLDLLRQFDPAFTNPGTPPARYGFTPGNVAVTFEVKEPRLRVGDVLYFALDPQTEGTGGARAMTRRSDGFWEVTLTLPAGRVVEYKFLVKDAFGQLHWEGGPKHFYTPVFDMPAQRWSDDFRLPPEGP